PAQPLSPLLQPPLPEHVFWPLQLCLPALSSALAGTLSAEPAARPAATAPMTFVKSRRFMRDSSLKPPGPSPRRRLSRDFVLADPENAIHYRHSSAAAAPCMRRVFNGQDAPRSSSSD